MFPLVLELNTLFAMIEGLQLANDDDQLRKESEIQDRVNHSQCLFRSKTDRHTSPRIIFLSTLFQLKNSFVLRTAKLSVCQSFNGPNKTYPLIDMSRVFLRGELFGNYLHVFFFFFYCSKYLQGEFLRNTLRRFTVEITIIFLVLIDVYCICVGPPTRRLQIAYIIMR